MRMNRKKFEKVVEEALDELPEEIAEALSNVYVVVEDWPSREALESTGLRDRYELLALYEGVPLTDRGTSYAALPDRITIFQGPIESISRTDPELLGQIKKAVVHEIAHHFGIDDDRIHELGY
ncbi:MAG: metallopeptidase family protein [Candidatus Abyssobacteria bacterium SURF_17]|uniref:Metallopeptidase family protein n=1 Tax=Candidatus Abyssobacteria bacterium SURF_17 TaxID=2093361 RepID=A0A419EMX3_9BACT|nr:MAG: metallopeptidase family protein [Candidatus Abyssubacteria bacterium SURF_17]